ncbi:hypothetical protein QAD02_001460 [Eretmocerus hayati]|uniref:Uncharacterized protein n=1 Tax=Eretmocerus hayati TaxID=131215 RepID=A0ACC2NH05_9HYME|nr:hypothetical protein QAD02_001460 [Eretmocerus hayati]
MEPTLKRKCEDLELKRCLSTVKKRKESIVDKLADYNRRERCLELIERVSAISTAKEEELRDMLREEFAKDGDEGIINIARHVYDNVQNSLIVVDKMLIDEIAEYTSDSVTDMLSFVDAYSKITFKDLLTCPYEFFKEMSPDDVFVSEYCLYEILGPSSNPVAREFRRWLASEFLPRVRYNHSINEYIRQRTDFEESLGYGLDYSSGVVFLTTTPEYKEKNIYVIGFTKDLHRRIRSLNRMCVLDRNKFEILQCWETYDGRESEREIYAALVDKRLEGTDGFFTFDNEEEAKNMLSKVMFKFEGKY